MGHELLVCPIAYWGLSVASICWVASAIGFHLAGELHKAISVWLLLPSTVIIAHGLAMREARVIRVMFEYCCSILLAYIIRDSFVYHSTWGALLRTLAATPVCHCYYAFFFGMLMFVSWNYG
jgi:hypothetical protein